MKVFRPGKDSFISVTKDDKKIRLMKNEVFEQFNPTILDLGNLEKESTIINTICAIFDLQGFTNFCKQIDPHLSVPSYLSGFLDWIFAAIAAETVEEKMKEGVQLWHSFHSARNFLATDF